MSHQPESWYRLITRAAAQIRKSHGVPDQATEDRMVRVFRAALRPRRKAGRKPTHATARAAEMWIAGMEEFHSRRKRPSLRLYRTRRSRPRGTAERPRRRTGRRQGGRAIMEAMATVHMSEAEVARDPHAVLAKVQQGVEIVIEQDHRPVAVLKPSVPARPGRKLSECIAMAKAYEAKLGYSDESARRALRGSFETGGARRPVSCSTVYTVSVTAPSRMGMML